MRQRWKHLRKGVSYYLKNLFDDDGLPKPFSKAPRLTVYKRELYDCAECINLCLLLRDRFPAIGEQHWRQLFAEFLRIGSNPMAHSVRAGYTWAGTTSRCIVGDSRRCFALSRFICARHLRSEIRSQRSDISQIAPAAEMLLRPGVTLQRFNTSTCF